MRIVVFLFTAATLHAVLLAFSYEGADQKVDEDLIGVALVQRHWDQPGATDGLKPQASSARFSEENLPDKITANRQPDVTEEVNDISVQEPVKEAEPPPPVAVADEPVVMPPAQVDRKPDELAPPLETKEKAARIPVSATVEQVEESTVQHESVPTEAVQPLVQHAANDVPVETEQHAVAAIPSAMTGQAAQQSPPQQAQPRYGVNPSPAYPGIARRRGWEGTVEVNVKVLRNGRVAEVQIKKSSGYRSLDHAARKSILRWRFSPAIRSGREIESWVVVPVQFVLDARSNTR